VVGSGNSLAQHDLFVEGVRNKCPDGAEHNNWVGDSYPQCVSLVTGPMGDVIRLRPRMQVLSQNSNSQFHPTSWGVVTRLPDGAQRNNWVRRANIACVRSVRRGMAERRIRGGAECNARSGEAQKCLDQELQLK